VLEKAFAVGIGGIVGQNVRLALDGLGVRVHDVIAGLGGRAITSASLRAMIEDGLAGRLGSLTFLDMDWELVARELERPSGPHAENMLRDLQERVS
jgi:pyruvate ferredoxin oxidoreductase alpha subunit